MHIQRHTYTSTHVQSAHKRNGDNKAQELVERGGRKALLETWHTKTNVRKNLIFTTNLKKI